MFNKISLVLAGTALTVLSLTACGGAAEAPQSASPVAVATNTPVNTPSPSQTPTEAPKATQAPADPAQKLPMPEDPKVLAQIAAIKDCSTGTFLRGIWKQAAASPKNTPDSAAMIAHYQELTENKMKELGCK